MSKAATPLKSWHLSDGKRLPEVASGGRSSLRILICCPVAKRSVRYWTRGRCLISVRRPAQGAAGYRGLVSLMLWRWEAVTSA